MSQLKKLEREQKFNPDEFNKKFEEADMIIHDEGSINHQKIQENINYTENFGINMKNLFFEILKILINKKNPIPYIMDNEKRVFLVSMMILIIGILLLFWSNLIINEL